MCILSPLSLCFNLKTFNLVTLSALSVWKIERIVYKAERYIGLGLIPGVRNLGFLAQILSISCHSTKIAKSH